MWCFYVSHKDQKQWLVLIDKPWWTEIVDWLGCKIAFSLLISYRIGNAMILWSMKYDKEIYRIEISNEIYEKIQTGFEKE